MNGKLAVADRVIDRELREVIQWIWALLQIEERSVLYKFASKVYFR